MKSFYCACFLSFLSVLCATATGETGCLEKETANTLLETVEDLLRKARNYLPCKEYLDNTKLDECSEKKSQACIDISLKLISEIKENFPTCPKIIENDKPKDCSDIFASGFKKSGIYTIYPTEKKTPGKPLQVYCDMETDGGGWTMIQRRGKYNTQPNFYQYWHVYKEGFGNISEEFWLGNENIRVLCANKCEIRFDVMDKNGEKGFARYDTFYLLGSNYTIFISGYKGDIGDAMQHVNKWDFSTLDQGYYLKVLDHNGGWWYGDGNWCNPNGIMKFGQTERNTVHWWDWRGYDNLAYMEIKIRPNEI